VEAERKKALDVARAQRLDRLKDEQSVLEQAKEQQRSLVEQLTAQKEQFMAQQKEIADAQSILVPPSTAKEARLTVTATGADGVPIRADFDKAAIMNAALGSEQFQAKQSAMREEMKEMRSRMKEEKEKLLVEMERRRALLGEAREHTGVNAYQRELEDKARAEEARREEEHVARKKLEEETLRERERRQLESRENREVRAREREELEAEKMQRLEYERRTMVAELEAERARFELEKRAFQEGVSASQASMGVAAGGGGAGAAGGGAGMDPTGVAALEQIRAAVEAERKAQEAMLMAEQARMTDLMQRERRELEQRLAEEKAALEVRDRHQN